MFTVRFKLFRLLCFDVYLDLSWFVVALLLTWSLATSLFPHKFEGLSVSVYWWMGAVGTLGLFGSIVLHELGHSLMARQFGMQMKGITLFIFGGVAEMSEEPQSTKAEFFVAIAGPIVSILIAIVAYGLSMMGQFAEWPTAVVGVLWYLSWVNAIVVGFNLIPAFPLDGGRVLRSILWSIRGSLRWATRITSSIGSAFGFMLIMFGVFNFINGNVIGGMWQFMIGMFLRGAAQMSYQQVLIRRALEGEPVSRFMQTDVHQVPSSSTVEELIEHYIYRHQHKMFPVTDNGSLLGCVTVADIKQVPRQEWGRRTVGEIMHPCGAANTIEPQTDSMQALSRMSQNGASRLMVVDGDRLCGVVTLRDMMKFISLKIELEADVGDMRMRATKSTDGRVTFKENELTGI